MLGIWEVGDDLSQAGLQNRRGKVTNQRKGFHTETMSFLQIFKKFEIFGFPIFWRMLFKPKMEIILFLHSKCCSGSPSLEFFFVGAKNCLGQQSVQFIFDTIDTQLNTW